MTGLHRRKALSEESDFLRLCNSDIFPMHQQMYFRSQLSAHCVVVTSGRTVLVNYMILLKEFMGWWETQGPSAQNCTSAQCGFKGRREGTLWVEQMGKLIKTISNTGIFYVSGIVLVLYTIQIHLHPTLALWDIKYYCYPHFTVRATEAQGYTSSKKWSWDLDLVSPESVLLPTVCDLLGLASRRGFSLAEYVGDDTIRGILVKLSMSGSPRPPLGLMICYKDSQNSENLLCSLQWNGID